mmetsp:Transcript_3043/g.3547  ORF Transcript_3043/g.3547 Transcript_3043/m.3547 type:complete len:195 (+) Transcript_3043:1009-1593(+)
MEKHRFGSSGMHRLRLGEPILILFRASSNLCVICPFWILSIEPISIARSLCSPSPPSPEMTLLSKPIFPSFTLDVVMYTVNLSAETVKKLFLVFPLVPTLTTLTPSSSLVGTGTLARDDLNVDLAGGALPDDLGDATPFIGGGGGGSPIIVTIYVKHNNSFVKAPLRIEIYSHTNSDAAGSEIIAARYPFSLQC